MWLRRSGSPTASRSSRSLPTSQVTSRLLLVAAVPVAADTKSHERTGFFIGFGLGGGSAGAEPGPDAVAFGVTELSRESGGSGNFRFGWSVTDRMTLGLENSTWLKNYDIAGTSIDATITLNVTTFAMTYFPGNVGFYLRGGLGIGTAGVSYEQGGAKVSGSVVGPAILAATGYEWRLTRKFALGPQLQWSFLGIDDEDIENPDFFSITAQATWYW